MIVNKQKVLSLIYTFTLMNILLCIQFILKYVVSNMLFDPHNSRNTLLQIKTIFDIGSTIYIIISFRLNNLVLIFIFKKLLMKYHDKTLITLFWNCAKNERFDHSSNICFSLIPYLPIIIVRMRDLNYLF